MMERVGGRTLRSAVLGILPSLTAITSGATYVVDPAGDDDATGVVGSPWRTLQHAANQVEPGDRVLVRPGEYVGFHLTTSGLSGEPIEFLAEPGAVITTRNATTPDGVNLEGASHVVVDGFEVVGMPRAGVRAVGPFVNGGQAFASHITIRGVTSRDNGKWGILTGFVDDVLIENNRTSGSIDEHGIYVSNSGDRPVIRGNEIWGNRANGIHVNSDRFAGLDGVIEEALIVGNVIYDNGLGGGSGINLDGVRDSQIVNNLIYESHASGISLYRIDGALPATGNLVAYNTIHQAADGRWALNLQDGAADNTLLNNVLLSEHSFRGAIDASPDSLSGLVSNHNVVIGRFTTDDSSSVLSLDAWQAATGQDADSLEATPEELFVDPAAGDYRLLADAPARDAGVAVSGFRSDLLDVPRPVGASPDIGAYEWRATGDYDADGLVYAADRAAWAAAYGLTVSAWASADGNGDGAIDAADYTVWRDAAAATSVAVPEPASLAFAVCGLSILSAGARRRAAARPVLPE